MPPPPAAGPWSHVESGGLDLAAVCAANCSIGFHRTMLRESVGAWRVHAPASHLELSPDPGLKRALWLDWCPMSKAFVLRRDAPPREKGLRLRKTSGDPEKFRVWAEHRYLRVGKTGKLEWSRFAKRGTVWETRPCRAVECDECCEGPPCLARALGCAII